MNIKPFYFTLTLLSSLILTGAALSSFTVDPLSSAVNADEAFKYRKITNNAFTNNEKLEFRVHYGLINAASIVFV